VEGWMREPVCCEEDFGQEKQGAIERATWLTASDFSEVKSSSNNCTFSLPAFSAKVLRSLAAERSRAVASTVHPAFSDYRN
jgi:hypothetical protein